MHENSLSAITDRYFKRFGYCGRQLESIPHPDTIISIVIPCYNEPGLTLTLDSLCQCEPPELPLEVLIVINSSFRADERVKLRNLETRHEVAQWKSKHERPWLKIHVLWIEDMPSKHAGVGLARKIGMDEALRRFAAINYKGMIICLDADCRVAPNYLRVLEKVQVNHQPQSCTIYFEHNMEQAESSELREGILYYELFLRYYVNALAYAQYPFAMHTVGSSMGVRADTYALSGGMNRRKAGEDFYFLHKVVPLGSHYSVCDTLVYPSSRLSDRVPFGTGKAQQEWMDNEESRQYTYHPAIFDELKTFIKHVPAFYKSKPLDEKFLDLRLPNALKAFLAEQNFIDKVNEIKANSSSYKTFQKRFFLWFDGFKALKFVHYCRDHYYEQLELSLASEQLLKKLGLDSTASVTELLRTYRRLDKSRNPVNLMLT